MIFAAFAENAGNALPATSKTKRTLFCYILVWDRPKERYFATS
jgi:hypothetical protein